MIKCTEALFSETSPTTFFRKPPKRISQEKSQITDSQIIEKLQLILLSIREQSVKTFSYFEEKHKKLQHQNGQQLRLIKLFQEQNALLKKFLQIYVQKYGQIGPEMRVIQNIETVRSQLELQISQNKDSTQTQSKCTSKQWNYQSTNYICTNQNIQILNSPNTTETLFTSINQIEDHVSESYTFSGLDSTISSFHKKLHPYHVENAQQKNLFQTQIQAQQTKQLCEKTSDKPEIRKANGQKIDQLSKQEIQQDYDLGIESKGENFFRSDQISFQEETIYQALPADEKQVNQKDPNPTQQQYFSCFQGEDGQTFQQLKTDSDIKRMRKVLDSKYTIQSNSLIPKKLALHQRTQFLSQIQPNVSPSEVSQLKTLNSSYFKNLQFYGNKQEQNDFIMVQKEFSPKNAKDDIKNMRTQLRLLEKKLKALFQPLPPNIVSKKIPLPRTNQELKNFHDRESRSIQKLNQMFKCFQKNSFKHEIEGSQQKKRSNLNKRIV